MVSRRLLNPNRIPTMRPLRPPAVSRARNCTFTQKSQLLLVAQRAIRPQLAYLSQPALRGSARISRFLSTESKAFIRETAIYTGKIGFVFSVITICAFLISTGVKIESDERKHPTPKEWSFRARERLRELRNLLEAGHSGSRIVDWTRVAAIAERLLSSLEDKEDEVKLVGRPKLTVQGHRVFGYDVSTKSYEWRTCYYEVCMACAKAAEHLQDSVVDTTRRIVFPKEVMIGPSNPDPRPVPPYMPAAPLEENCQPAFAPPEVFYKRVLDGVGFTTKQQLDAATAYATWLEYSGEKESAEEWHKWAVEITRSAISGAEDNIMDSQTFVLRDGPKCEASANLLRATTDLAAFYARNSDVSSALPILLSVLRARRVASVDASESLVDSPQEKQDPAEKTPGSSFNLFDNHAFPPPPPSGNTPYVRRSERPSCEESELMLYIGEILFAMGRQTDEGLAWTRQAVNIADANLEETQKQSLSHNDQSPSTMDLLFGAPLQNTTDGETERCKDCMFTGVQNWQAMLMQLAEQRVSGGRRQSAGWSSWFGRSTPDARTDAELEEELKQVGRLKDKLIRDGIAKEMIKFKGQSSGLWIG